MVLGLDGQIDAQIEEERAAIEIEPNNIDARIGLATALNKKGQKDEAVKELKVVLEKHPDNKEAQTLLASLKK